jgi:hypothetical protein
MQDVRSTPGTPGLGIAAIEDRESLASRLRAPHWTWGTPAKARDKMIDILELAVLETPFPV